MEPTAAYWLAALMDGEGSIMIRDRHRKSGRLNVVAVFANNDRALLEQAQRWAGGSIYRANKRCWQLQVFRTDEVGALLKAIEPILITKRERAQRALVVLEGQGEWVPPRDGIGRFVLVDAGGSVTARGS
jgi:predicted ATPase